MATIEDVTYFAEAKGRLRQATEMRADIDRRIAENKAKAKRVDAADWSESASGLDNTKLMIADSQLQSERAAAVAEIANARAHLETMRCRAEAALAIAAKRPKADVPKLNLRDDPEYKTRHDRHSNLLIEKARLESLLSAPPARLAEPAHLTIGRKLASGETVGDEAFASGDRNEQLGIVSRKLNSVVAAVAISERELRDEQRRASRRLIAKHGIRKICAARLKKLAIAMKAAAVEVQIEALNREELEGAGIWFADVVPALPWGMPLTDPTEDGSLMHTWLQEIAREYPEIGRI